MGWGGCEKRQAPDGPTPTTVERELATDPRPQRESEVAGIESTPEATLARIARLMEAGNLHQAQRDLQAYLLGHPNDPRALVLAAQLASARGEIDEAVSLLDAAADHSADRGPYLKSQAGVLLAQAQRWQDAITRLEAVVDEHPDLDVARHELVELLNQRGFRFDANEHVRELCRRNEATLDELRGLIVPARSHTGFSEKPDVGDREQVERLGPMNVARAVFGAGDVQDAATALKGSRVLRENHPAAVAFYGQVLLESQQFDAFQSWLQRASPECQRYPAYWMALGGWAMHQRDHPSAVRMFAEAILREPGDLAANDRMTQTLSAAGFTEESEQFRQRGVDIDLLIRHTKELLLDPNGLKSVNEISPLLNRIGRPLESLAWYRLALVEMGSPPDAMRNLDEAMARMSQTEFQDSLRQTRLCGIDLTQFPLDVSSVATAAVPTSRRRMQSDPTRPKPLQPVFVNVAPRVGIDFRYRNALNPVRRELLMFQQTGGGVACFDYDLDGRVDFYVGQAASDPPDGRGTQPNRLFRQVDDRFEGTTELAGCDDRHYTCGVTSGDWNQDGFPDLVVANMQRNTLFINQGDGTFRVQPGDSVWDQPMYSASLAMGDLDGDQLPDIVEINYLDDPRIFDPIEHHPDGTPVQLPAPMHYQPAVDRVFLSRGDGSLSGHVLGGPDRSAAATGLGVMVTDIDGSPGNEILVANDHMANHLWQRDKDSESGTRWQNIAAVRGVAYGASGMPLGCMGIAAADFDENGRLDFHITNFQDQWSNQYMQDDDGFFLDLVVAFDLAAATLDMVGFGTQVLDYDNNSVVDLVIGNGHIEDLTAQGSLFEMPTQMFAMEGSRFVPLRVSGDPSYWESGHLSRGLATCDWNNDGRVDFVVTDLSEPMALLENRTASEHHWLQLQLVGVGSERDAIGATVRVSFADRTITKVVQAGDGYMSKNQSLLNFGLGESDTIDRLEIRWPDGGRQSLTGLQSDRRWLVVQNDNQPFRLSDDEGRQPRQQDRLN